MSNTPPCKPKRKLTSLVLSAPARGALGRIQKHYGWTKTRAIEFALASLDTVIKTTKEQV